jgi:hypothetical protein
MIRIIFCAATLLLLLSQCSPVYVPNTRNAPLFAKGGEFQGAMQFGTAGIDLQGAVSVTNNIALMGNYSYGNRNTDTLNNDSDLDNYHKHKFYEGAIGYYKNDNQFCFEVFLGYGRGEGTAYGSYSIFSSNEDEITKGKYNRIFLQPSFGLNKKVVHVAFSPRFSWVDFTEFSNTSSPVKIDFEPKLFIEPAVTAKFNFLDNRFFGTIQAGISTTLAENIVFDYEHFNISTGLGIRLGGLRWSKDETEKAKE